MDVNGIQANPEARRTYLTLIDAVYKGKVSEKRGALVECLAIHLAPFRCPGSKIVSHCFISINGVRVETTRLTTCDLACATPRRRRLAACMCKATMRNRKLRLDLEYLNTLMVHARSCGLSCHCEMAAAIDKKTAQYKLSGHPDIHAFAREDFALAARQRAAIG